MHREMEQEQLEITRHRIVFIHDSGIQYFDLDEDIVKAEEIEYVIRQNKGVQSVNLGDINGPEYITIYCIPREVEDDRIKMS